jgi:hypothetical protein
MKQSTASNGKFMAKVYLLCVILSLSAGAQVNCLKFKTAAGAPIGSPICRPVTLQAGSNVTFTPAPNWTMVLAATAQASIGNIRLASTFIGADVGAKINAADTDLGSSPGEIWVTDGGVISTQIVVSPYHVLRLLPGIYTNALGLRLPVIRLSDNSSLIGEGLQTIVQESSNAANSQPVIVCGFNLGVQCTTLTGSTTNIHISGVHFQGANPNVGTSLIDSVSLGNCSHCSVTDNWFDNIATSHILVGGTSSLGNWADGFEISGNHFSGAANCSVCLINGQNVSIHTNFWALHGNGAAADIDIEPNSTTDRAQHIDIHNNLFDESAAVQTVYCVTVQNGPFVNMGFIKIHDNNCSAGPFSAWGGTVNSTFKLVNCFTAGPGAVNSMSDIEVYNNTCRLSSSSGITMVGVNRGSIRDNYLTCVGDVAVNLAGSVTNSIVERNHVLSVASPNSCPQSAKSAYLSAIVGETNSSNANNVFRDNIATATVLNGSGSKAPTATLPDGSGQSFHVPVGLNAGLQGGLQITSVGTPTLSLTGSFAGVCALASNTYFWKVRAVGAIGGMGVPSNEVTAATGGSCKTLLWNKAAGAKSYNVYRGTASGAEFLIANVSDGSVRYDDLGGQTPTTAIDSNDSSGGLQLNTEVAPTCAAAFAGLFTYTAGGAGVKDTVQVCAKDGADSYAYRAIY